MMAALLERLFGRLPIGWLQLSHNKGRLAAALAGVAFANLLVFMQLGFLGALLKSVGLPWRAMNAEIVISASDMNSLADGSPIPRQRLMTALGVEGVASIAPLYFGRIDWRQPDGTVRNLDIFGVDPADAAFVSPEVQARRADLAAGDRALIDRRTRNVPPEAFAALEAGRSFSFETKGRTLEVVGAFTIGGGFAADGYLIVSDQTFFRLFPARSPGAPNYGLARLAPGADAEAVAARLAAVLPAYDSAAWTLEQAIQRDQRFQTTQKPVGVIFGFGVAIGLMVGVIIVYQVLSTDVADHIREYATFKAMGYGRGFFLGVVFEEALILAILGFLPGLAAALGLYQAVAAATGLPMSMTLARALGVLAGAVVMCSLSGALATRRLARANPADLF